jgi:L-seryl-tRNA(Ser) seleniumtransferase
VSPANLSVDQLAAQLRAATPPVVGRVHRDRLHLDLRSVFPRQDQELVAAVVSLGRAETET